MSSLCFELTFFFFSCNGMLCVHMQTEAVNMHCVCMICRDAKHQLLHIPSGALGTQNPQGSLSGIICRGLE